MIMLKNINFQCPYFQVQITLPIQWISLVLTMPKFELEDHHERDLSKFDQENKLPSQKFKFNRDNIVRKRHSELTEKYLFGDKIGEGSFGQVYKIIHKELNVTRALKIIKKSPDSTNHNSYDQLQILKKLDHPNVLKIYEYYQSDTNWFIITEYFQGRQLFDEIVSQKRLTQRKAALIFSEICKAIAYIHANSIVHRDIKPQNILVKKNNGGKSDLNQDEQNVQFQIKVIDWGLGSLSIKEMIRKCGTPQYCAPEVLKSSYGFQCDLWSLGVLLYVMLAGKFPFKGSTVQQTLSLVTKGKINFKSPEWQGISIEAKYLISCLIKKQPEQRLKASEVLKSEWILNHLQTKKQQKSKGQQEQQQNDLKQTLIRLKQVSINNKLQVVIINLIHNYIQFEEEEKKLKNEFESLDENKDGVLSYQQLLRGYQKIYPHFDRNKLEDIVTEIFKNVDIDGSGKIQYSQFITFATKISKRFSLQQLKQVFSLLDEDGNGTINKKELNQVLMYEKGVQSQQFDKIISEVDLNKDGSIDFEQFVACINKAVSKVISENLKKKKQKKKPKPKSKSKSKSKSKQKTSEGQNSKNNGQRHSQRIKIKKDKKREDEGSKQRRQPQKEEETKKQSREKLSNPKHQ